MKKDVKTSTVFIRGLPLSVKDSALTESFEDYGNIRQAFVTKQKVCQGQSVATQIGYVKFTTIEEATLAINSVKSIAGKNVSMTYARKKPRKFRQPVAAAVESKGDGSGLSDSDEDVTKPAVLPSKSKKSPQNKCANEKPIVDKSNDRKTSNSHLTENNVEFPKNAKTIFLTNLLEGLTDKDVRKKCRKIGTIHSIIMDKTSAAVTFTDESSAKTAIKKLNNHVYKQTVISVVLSTISEKAIKKMNTPSRIIIRNLSFKVTEELLRTELMEFGKLMDLSVPKAETGKVKGFAFVSYLNKFEANKAIQKLNGKLVLGRKIAVDWAVAKDQYSKNKENSKCDENDENSGDDSASNDNNSASDKEESDNSDHESIADDVEMEADNGSEGETSIEPTKKEYDDVKEGRTIFMGNLPFDVEKEDIEDTFSVFGEIHYVRMVYDKEKDRPKGIAFMQFKERCDADSCLERAQVQPICISGRTITVNRAVDNKNTDSTMFSQDKTSKSSGKDNRNLHLAMEGVIKEGTNAAVGVSKTDAMKRKLALEAKKKKLKNINCFVSTDRLCVRNMPAKFNETELKKLMSKYGNVTQVKIMRDIKQANSEGIGKSKGYGFVQFSKHETALAALRGTNNNPNVFTPLKRPIVDFSIENSNILTARTKKFASTPTENRNRPKKSFNQRWKDKREIWKEEGGIKKKNPKPETENDSPKEKKPKKKVKQKKKVESGDGKTEVKVNSTSVSDAVTAQNTAENAKSPKRPKLKNRSERPNKKQKRDQDNTEEAAFQKLVQTYKGKLESEDPKKSFKKWYDSD